MKQQKWKRLFDNKLLFFLFLSFILVNIVDSITAKYILLGESNPIYIYTGTLFYVLFLKIVIILGLGFFIYRNIYPTNFTYYLIILILVLGTFVVGIGSYGNIIGILNPEQVVQAGQIPNSVKVEQYQKTMLFVYLIPVIACIVTFLIYDKSQKYVIVDSDYFTKKPWWKRW